MNYKSIQILSKKNDNPDICIYGWRWSRFIWCEFFVANGESNSLVPLENFVWMVGRWLDDRFKITSKTKGILRIMLNL